ncbi:PepSY-associated TM helix domain-containing protein [Dyadobacter crusticola]|uniref:PepSY-associated TM helix domain-containing protein n=1 Tax=Dyadobacter crusticola TaxID=292407 RepID=UPI0004E1A6EC|nr:PepSY-associated TM helix domain-containing protein [Dyadobacter crusticola]
MKKAFKKIASQLHLWLGIISGLVVFVVALTGCILVFEDELEPVLYPDFHVVEANTGERKLPLDHLESIIKYKFPEKKIQWITIEPEADRTIIFNLKTKEKEGLAAAIDPYTGRITAVRDEHEAFFSVVLRLHRYLCLEETGKAITGVACVMFLIVMITGLVLWWPNRKNQKQRFRVKWDAKFKRLNWDLHAVFGFYVLPFVFLIAATGLVWSYKWVNNLIYLTFDGKPPVIREAPVNRSVSDIHDNGVLEKILAETNTLLPNPGRILFTMPKTDSLSISISKADDYAAVSNIVSFLYFDKNNGNLISKRLYDNETRGMKVRRLVYPIHTGNIWGLPSKIVAFLVAFIAASLPVTGVVIWLGKKRKSKKKLGKMKVAGGNVRVEAIRKLVTVE